MSGIRLLDYSKLAINRKNKNDVTIYRHNVIVKCFWCYFVSLLKFSYWSNFCVNIVSIYFYKGLTRNPEIRNAPVWVLLKIWRLGWVRDTKFGTDISNEMLLNAAKCQGCNFYRFWVIKRKATGRDKITPLPSRWRLKGVPFIAKVCQITVFFRDCRTFKEPWRSILKEFIFILMLEKGKCRKWQSSIFNRSFIVKKTFM